MPEKIQNDERTGYLRQRVKRKAAIFFAFPPRLPRQEFHAHITPCDVII
jgi:hypothetical protein